MGKLPILILLLFSLEGLAQFAIVKDKDGYVNVRSEAGTSSPVIDTLTNDRLVYCFEPQGEWLPIDYKRKGKSSSGYIHQSRLVLINSFTGFSTIKQNDSLIQLKLDSAQITIASGKFSKAGRQLKYEKIENGSFLSTIDNKTPWGTDGNLPKQGYRFIKIKSGSKETFIAKKFLDDLFEPNMHMTAAYLEPKSGILYITALNSDGAGGYAVIWVIKGGKVLHRETFIPF